MVNAPGQPAPVPEEDAGSDAGQSAFLESQENNQAPPLVPETPAQKKRKRLIALVVVGFTLFITTLMILPRSVPEVVVAPPEATASPRPEIVPVGWEVEFNKADEVIKEAELDLMIAPPRPDMQVVF